MGQNLAEFFSWTRFFEFFSWLSFFKSVQKKAWYRCLVFFQAKWWYEDSKCRAPSSLLGNSGRHNQSSELTLANLSGLFFVLVLGLILAMVLALCEFCHNSRQESKRGKIPFSGTHFSKTVKKNPYGNNYRLGVYGAKWRIASHPIARNSEK